MLPVLVQLKLPNLLSSVGAFVEFILALEAKQPAVTKEPSYQYNFLMKNHLNGEDCALCPLCIFSVVQCADAGVRRAYFGLLLVHQEQTNIELGRRPA